MASVPFEALFQGSKFDIYGLEKYLVAKPKRLIKC